MTEILTREEELEIIEYGIEFMVPDPNGFAAVYQ